MLADSMAGQLRHNQQNWYHLEKQAQSYLININLFRCALTERKAKVGFLSTTPSIPAIPLVPR